MLAERSITVARTAVLSIALALATGACRDEVDDGSIQVPSDNQRLKQEMATMAGQDVVTALGMPDSIPGRIVYDPPPDLSYASAQRMRPDIVGRDTAAQRGAAARARSSTVRDTTAGDASADTSGGAARARRNRP